MKNVLKILSPKRILAKLLLAKSELKKIKDELLANKTDNEHNPKGKTEEKGEKSKDKKEEKFSNWFSASLATIGVAIGIASLLIVRVISSYKPFRRRIWHAYGENIFSPVVCLLFFFS